MITAIGTVAQAVIALLAALVVWREYGESKRVRRSSLALHLISQVERDELARFAAISLDWGGGTVVAPPSWRDILTDPKPQYSERTVEDALEPDLNRATIDSTFHQLYRQAFVNLFNHFEIIAMHARVDRQLLDELEPVADLAHRLLRPYYVQKGRPIEKRDLYRRAIASWYGQHVLSFIQQIDERFPEETS